VNADAGAPAGAVGHTPRKGRWARISLGWKIFGAMVFLAGIPGTFLGLWQVLHPDYPEAAVESAAVAPHPQLNVALSKFLADNPDFAPRERFTTAQLSELGDAFSVDFTLVGLSGKSSKLLWFPVNANSTQEELPWPDWAPRELVLQPTRDEFPVHAEVWVPSPIGDGEFIERFEVRRPDGARLKHFDSPDTLRYFTL